MAYRSQTGPNLRRVRERTAERHRALEGLIPLTSPDLTLNLYGAILRRFGSFYARWEAKARAEAPAALQPLLADRARLHLLYEDLAALGLEPEEEPMPSELLPDLDLESSLLGSMYVTEGSTLGGQVISRAVARRLELHAGRGTAFFRGYGDETGQRWKSFCERIDSTPAEWGERMAQGAVRTFEAFQTWLEPVCRAGGVA